MFDLWQHEICSTFVPLRASPTQRGAQSFRGKVLSSPLGAVTLAQVTASRAVVERTPWLIRQGDPELYKFGLQVAGSCVIEQDGRQACLGAGDLAIYDTSRPYRLRLSDDFQMVVAMFPRHLVQLPAAAMASITAVRLAGDQGLAALLTPLMRGLSADLALTGGVFASHLGEAVIDLVTAAFAQELAVARTGGEIAGGHHALVAQVSRFIDENLHDPALSSAAIAARHFVSVRQLQKVFEAEGEAVTTLIRNRRLQRCRRDLADPHLREEPIAAIGARWGFLDAAHFSRLFRSTFGCSPREYRLQRSG